MSELVLSPGQAEGVIMVEAFLKQDAVRVAKITGYAGTGKTTLIGELSDRFGIPTVLTPTGKAALRVREASGVFAMTIHRFLYDPSEDPKTGKPLFKLKESWDELMEDMTGKLVLVDEASMVDKKVWDDLLRVAERNDLHVLLMGDLFQLPPVHKDEEGRGFSALNHPTPFNVDMKDVIRQALDSPIVRASMVLRSGKPEYEALGMLDPVGQDRLIDEIVDGQLRGGTAICFTNARRHELNRRVRGAQGFAPNTLLEGEPVLVTQNNYKLNCWNGEVLTFDGWDDPPVESDEFVATDRYTTSSMAVHFGVGKLGKLKAVMAQEQFGGLTEAARIGSGAIKKAARSWYQINHDLVPIPFLECQYGDTLTCHKAQGSEWPEVIVVIEDSLSMLRGLEKKRWLYTALTRGRYRVRYCYVEGR